MEKFEEVYISISTGNIQGEGESVWVRYLLNLDTFGYTDERIYDRKNVTRIIKGNRYTT